MLHRAVTTDSRYVQERVELRAQVARWLEQHAPAIVNDAAAVFPFAGVGTGASDAASRLAELLLALLTVAARDGELDPRSEAVADLRQQAAENALATRHVFGLVYVVERSALDELALDESFGATSEPWPALAQIVRRSSFEVLAAYADRAAAQPEPAALVDRLTTLHTRAVLEAALEKEIQRAERLRHPFALMLIDVDRLAAINEKHGYGSGDRVLERLGILMRNYFREQDWVARFAGDAFGIILPETQREHATLLAERLRATVEGRLALHDYRSQEDLAVTISLAVVVIDDVDSQVRAGQLFDEARRTMERAKLAGRNRVETAEISLRSATPPPRDNPFA